MAKKVKPIGKGLLIFFKFFIIFLIQASSIVKLKSASDYIPYSRDTEKTEFTQEQKINKMLERLCKQCKATQNRGAPKQTVIDAAHELVQIDNQYKAEATAVSAFLFHHPYFRDMNLFFGGAAVGAISFWLSS